jgi:hypothetical protein
VECASSKLKLGREGSLAKQDQDDSCKQIKTLVKENVEKLGALKLEALLLLFSTIYILSRLVVCTIVYAYYTLI